MTEVNQDIIIAKLNLKSNIRILKLPTPYIQQLVNELLKHGISIDVYSYVIVALIVFLSSVLGAYTGAYLKKRGEEKAMQANVKSILKRIKQTTSLSEEIKASINISTVEHQIKFNKLHDKKIEVIEGLFQRLIKMEDACKEYLLLSHPTRDLTEKFSGVQNDISEFISYSKFNEFWIEDDLFNEIKAICLKIDKIAHEDFLNSNIPPSNTQALINALKKHKLFIEKMNDEIPKAKKNLIYSIRRVLNPNNLSQNRYLDDKEVSVI